MMRKFLLQVALSLHCLALVSFHNLLAQNPAESYVVMVSFDGFRYDYVEQHNLSNFKKLISEGTAADGLIPAYPSKTFPNHYSLATGMHPGTHGIIDNTFFDTKRQETYRIKDRDKVEDPYWYSGTPIWTLARQQGRKSASFFWVGSEINDPERQPNYFYRYDGSITNEARIQQVKAWFEMPAQERPQIVMLYFSITDEAGHKHGPESEEQRQSLIEADRLLGLLMEEVSSIDLPINLLIVSDHGMLQMPNLPEHFIDLASLVDLSEVSATSNSFHVHIHSDERSKLEKVYAQLQALPKELPFKSYWKADIPAHLNYNNNPRIGDILVIAKAPYYLGVGEQTQHWQKRPLKGQHGYDPYDCPEMVGIFYAWGPNIRQNLRIPAFELVHVYPLVAKILNLQIPADIDGRIEVLQDIYQPYKP
ncbi:ectonucleotide pyrophosphatase/phosphodiesterase [Eisenibacter elegans]|uniref:alkaline phosphatase family protein n=1 Tax=Eisenibacter elegans TaxID=997 RepID=UPI00047EB433|nr:ectonucleotide pyrophosphatase/phosphodiesterase [Eisenibacter elegans]